MSDDYYYVVHNKSSLPKLSKTSPQRSSGLITNRSFQEEPKENQLRNKTIQQIGHAIKSNRDAHLIQIFNQQDVDTSNHYKTLIRTLNLFLQEIYRFLCKQAKEVQTLKQELQESQKKVKTQEGLNDKLAETIKIQNQYSYLNAYEIEREKKERQRQVNRITFENVGLETQIKKMIEKLKIMETHSDLVSLRRQIEELHEKVGQQQREFAKQMLENEDAMHKNHLTISNLKTSNHRYENEITQFQSMIDQQHKELTELSYLQDYQRECIEQQNERLAMQAEEILTRQIEQHKQYKLLDKSQEKMQKLQAKLDQLQIERSVELDIPDNENFTKQLQEQIHLQYYFKRDASYFIQSHLKRNERLDDDSDLAHLEDDLSDKFHFSFPVFMIFLEHQSKNIESELANIKNRRIDPHFFFLIRSIWDSYWNEFHMIEDLKANSRFCDFAYNWLNHFTIDKKARCIRALNEQEQERVEDCIIKFYMDLHSPLLLKIWEVRQFKHMLEEHYSRDQIYFFLYCRNLLLRGQATQRDNPSSAVQYISLSHAELVVEVVLEKYEYHTIQHARQALRKSSKRVSVNFEEICMIDCGWVMQVLMQFFRIEKKQKYGWVQLQFAAAQGLTKPSKIGLSFRTFRKMMRAAFPDATVLQTAQLFRECLAFNPVQGVTPEAFMVVATENHFFTSQLHVYVESHLNVMNKNQMLTRKGAAIMEIFQYLRKCHEEIQFKEIIEEYCIPCGQSELMEQLEQLQGFLVGEKRRLSGLNVHLFMCGLTNKLRKLKQVKLMHEQLHSKQQIVATTFGMHLENFEDKLGYNNFGSSNFFRPYNNPHYNFLHALKDQMSDLDDTVLSLEKTTQNERYATALHSFRVNLLFKSQKIKKVQKFFRWKFTKFYTFISSLLNTKIKASITQQEQQVAKPDKKISKSKPDKRRQTKRM